VAYDSLSVSELIPAPPERIYAAWLSSDEHTAITGDKAVVEPFVGGKHSTFDGYAVGQTVELQPGRRIVQTWRAEDFPLGSPDSRVEVTLEETVGGTMVTIFHTEIPSGQGASYRDAWVQYYLEPLKGYFVAAPRRKANGVPTRAPAPKEAATKTAAKVAKKVTAKATTAKPATRPRRAKPAAARTAKAAAPKKRTAPSRARAAKAAPAKKAGKRKPGAARASSKSKRTTRRR
jgi:uncharacterized protein YndB with AHSA1/START domain